MGAVHSASDSTAKNLDAVARHYADAEYHSSITPGAPLNTHRRANSGGSVTAGNVARLANPPIEPAPHTPQEPGKSERAT
jgi:hypothetical protein